MMFTRPMTIRLTALMGAMFLAILAAPATHADPLPGQVLKFAQKPMVGTPVGGQVYFGHDEWSTLYEIQPGLQQYGGIAMADDFADEFTTPVVHVKWWGSYLDNQIIQQVDKFLIAFESDTPAGPANPFSHPNQALLSQIVTRGALTPASGTFTEAKIVPGIAEEIYQYNAELKMPFNQLPDTVYWIKIAALVDNPNAASPNTIWGWHNRDYTVTNPLASAGVTPGEFDEALGTGYPSEVWHFQDDAVSADTSLSFNSADGIWAVNQTNYVPQFYVDGIDGPGQNLGVHDGVARFSKDLAFELYTVPEPASAALFGLGACMLLRRRKRQDIASYE